MSNSPQAKVSFHTATLNDVHQMMEWAAQEGWNPGIDDAEAFWSADKSGFFIARVADEMVAAISVVNHDEQMAFLGLYLCKPEFRGQGIGFGLWNHALQHADTRCVGLDGVAAQEANYVKSGFVRQGTVTRLEGKCPQAVQGNTRMVDVTRDYERLAQLDAQAIGYTRPQFLSQWVGAEVPTRQTVVVEHAGSVEGFATVRMCHDGVKIGPIVARDDQDAMALLTAASGVFDTQKVIVDLPDNQTELMNILCGLGFINTFQTAHMFRGQAPETSKLYRAVATMECG